MNDGRPRPVPGPAAQPATSGAVTDPSTAPIAGALDRTGAPAAFPSGDPRAPSPGANARPIVVTKPMAAQPLRQPPGGAAIVTHRATQMSASVGAPSTLESPKDALLLRAEAQTRIERPLASAIPSTLEDIDSTMPDNAARDAAIRDAARAADERAGTPSGSGSKRFGPPTLQSPNDGALPSSPAISLAGVVVDAVLPSAAFVRPEPPPTAPTHGGPPPLLAVGGYNAQPTAMVNTGGLGGGLAPPGAAPVGAHGRAPAPGRPPAEAWTGGPPMHAQTAVVGTGAAAGAPYFPQTGGIGTGSVGPAYNASTAPSASGSLPARAVRAKGSGATIFIVVGIVVFVLVLAFVGLGLFLRARAGRLSLPSPAPSGSAPAAARHGK